ncbi:MAG: hypothetical protein IH609_17680 [Dehalococcoidia bacterium]|nr:hypothetical protein [Dehalococcoidia bacterium]
MYSDFSLQPGPRAYESILTSPHKADIDERLFIRRQPVRKVHRWLTDELAVTSISYATLNRYKNAQSSIKGDGDADLRRAELKRDLSYLGRVVKGGKVALQQGLLVRPSEAIRAVELRTRILAEFPDSNEELGKRHKEETRALADIILGVVSEEQRVAIVTALDRHFNGGHGEDEGSDS